VLGDPDTGEVADLVARADRLAVRALHAFNGWQYLRGATLAYASFNTVRLAAERVGVPSDVPPSALRRAQVAPGPVDGPRPFDPIRG
jgi:hypothetical protein